MDSSFLNESSFLNGSHLIVCENSASPMLWVVLTAICTILGLPATVIVLKELYKRSHQRVTNEIFMINLTISDFFYLLVIPFSAINYIEWGLFAFQYINRFTITFILSSRPLFMACTCVDCYIAVVHPIAYKTSRRSRTIRILTSLIAWLIILCFSSYECTEIYSFIFTIYSIPLLLALPVIAFCDISILQALRRPGPTENSQTNPLKKRALHTVLNSLVATLTAYLPPVVIFSFADVIPVKIYFCEVFIFGYLFSMCGTCIMPFLYLDSTGKLESLKKWLKKYI